MHFHPSLSRETPQTPFLSYDWPDNEMVLLSLVDQILKKYWDKRLKFPCKKNAPKQTRKSYKTELWALGFCDRALWANCEEREKENQQDATISLIVASSWFSLSLHRTVGLHQQVQHSHHSEIPIQNSHSHNKSTPVCNKLYSTYRLQDPLPKWRHPWKNQ